MDDEAKTLESIRVLSQRTALAEAQARHRQLARMPVGGSGPPGLDLRTATGALTGRAGFRGPVYGFPAPGSSGFGSLSKVEAQTIATSRLYNDLADLGHPEVVREERLAGPKIAVFVHLREIMSMGGEQMTGQFAGIPFGDLVPLYTLGDDCHGDKSRQVGTFVSSLSDETSSLLDNLNSTMSGAKRLSFNSASDCIVALKRPIHALAAVFANIREKDLAAVGFPFIPLEGFGSLRPALLCAPGSEDCPSGSPLYFSLHAATQPGHVLSLLDKAVKDGLYDGAAGVVELERFCDSILRSIFTGMKASRTLTSIFLELANSVLPRLEGRAGAMSGLKAIQSDSSSNPGNGNGQGTGGKPWNKRGRGSAGGSGPDGGGGGQPPPKKGRFDGTYDTATKRYRTPSGYARIAGGQDKAPTCRSHVKASDRQVECCFSHAHLAKK